MILQIHNKYNIFIIYYVCKINKIINTNNIYINNNIINIYIIYKL